MQMFLIKKIIIMLRRFWNCFVLVVDVTPPPGTSYEDVDPSWVVVPRGFPSDQDGGRNSWSDALEPWRDGWLYPDQRLLHVHKTTGKNEKNLLNHWQILLEKNNLSAFLKRWFPYILYSPHSSIFSWHFFKPSWPLCFFRYQYVFPSWNQFLILTHYGLVTPYGDQDLGQH